MHCYLPKPLLRYYLTAIWLCVILLGYSVQLVAGTTSNVSVTEGNNVTVSYDLGYAAPAGGVDVEVVYQPTTASVSDYSIAANQLGWRTISAGNSQIDVAVSATSDLLIEGNEALMVGFLENLATDSGFDLSEGSNQWSGEDTTTEANVRFNGPAATAYNSVLHIKNKENPARTFTINPGDDYLFRFKYSPATASGSGAACNEPGGYSGYDNAADALELRVTDRNDPSNNEATIVIDYSGSGAPATFSFDDATVSLTGTTTAAWSSSVTVEFTVYDFSGSEYVSNCGFVVDDFRLTPVLPEISTVTITDPDATAPTLSSSNPSDGATAVGVSSNIVLTFSENIAAGTGDIIISDGASDTRTIPVSDAQVSISGTTLTINPTADLNSSTGYYVQIASTAIDDLSSNSYAGISDTTTLNFTTASGSTPTVTLSSSDVINGATSDHASISMSFSLSEPSVDFTASDVSVSGGTLSGFSGSGASYSATFTPSGEASYTLFVAAGMFTGTGSTTNQASGNFVWTYAANEPDDSFVSEAMTYLKQTIVSEAQRQGERLITASHKLIRTSVEHLIVRTRLAQTAPNRQADGAGTKTASSAKTESPNSDNRQSIMAHPVQNTVMMTAFSSSGDRESEQIQRATTQSQPSVIDGLQLLSVDADDEQYQGRLDFDLYRPLTASGDALITKIIAEISDQDDGPETTRIIASVGLEQKIDDTQIIGRYVHFTKEASDYNTRYTGSRDTYGASFGVYRIFSPRVNQLLSIYGSAGISTSDLVLKRDGVTTSSDYLSYNVQTGFSLSKTVKAQRLLSIYEFSGDLLYNYQTEHTARFSNGIAQFDRLMAGKAYHEYTASFSPKYVFSLSENAGSQTGWEQGRLLSFVPRIKCGSGSLDTSCGGGFGINLTKPFAKGNGFSTLGINYERYRKTDTISYFLDLNKQLGHENISLDTQLNHDTSSMPNISSPADYGIQSTLRIQF